MLIAFGRIWYILKGEKSVKGEYMDKKLKQHFLIVAFAVILFAALMNLGAVVNFAKNLLLLILPVVVGFLLAFVLNVPMRGFENLLNKAARRLKMRERAKLRRLAAIILTLLSVLLIVVLVCTMIIPELVSSFISLYGLVIEKWPEWASKLNEYNINTELITQWIESLNIGELVQKLTSGAGSIISSAVTIVSATVSGIATAGISIILSIYVLLSKDDLAHYANKFAHAFFKPKAHFYAKHVCKLTSTTYSKFLSGQCVEACILGCLIFIAMSIFGVPYASIIGVLTAVLAFVPYVGALAACLIGAILVLMANPSKVIVCVIVYIVVQFIENQFIYPNVVGTSVGIKPIWTLIAVIIGGKLLGLFGMIFFIPLFAVLISLLRDYTNLRLSLKQPQPKPEENKSEQE